MTSSRKYFGEFASRDDVARQFHQHPGDIYTSDPVDINADFPTEDQILFAEYSVPGYEGAACVLFERDGTLYEVHGSHCSCYGLEDQWAPEETSWAALAIRPDKKPLYESDADAIAAYRNLIHAHTDNS